MLAGSRSGCHCYGAVDARRSDPGAGDRRDSEPPAPRARLPRESSKSVRITFGSSEVGATERVSPYDDRELD